MLIIREAVTELIHTAILTQYVVLILLNTTICCMQFYVILHSVTACRVIFNHVIGL